MRWTSVEENFFSANADDSGSESTVVSNSGAAPSASPSAAPAQAPAPAPAPSRSGHLQKENGRQRGFGGHVAKRRFSGGHGERGHHWGAAPIAPRFERKAAQAAQVSLQDCIMLPPVCQ